MTINSRPRIWVTQATLPALKARAAAGGDRIDTLRAAAAQPADWDVGVQNYCLMYLLTGDGAYAAKAWGLMQQSMAAGVAQVAEPLPPAGVVHPQGIGEVTPDSGYQCRNYFPAAAIVYDWLHDWLQPADRAALKEDLEVCADWVWPETNPARIHQWGVDADMSGNNYHLAFQFTWMAGLALSGESSKAQGYIDNARRRWDTEILPYLQGPAQGGLFPEGLGYGIESTKFILWNLLAHQTATGENLIDATPWCHDAVSAMLHMTNPTLTEMAPFGDLAAGPIANKDRIVMMLMSAYDPRCKAWLDSIALTRIQNRLYAWAEFLFYPEQTLPFPTK